MAFLRPITVPVYVDREREALAFEQVQSVLIDAAEYGIAQAHSWEQIDVAVAQALLVAEDTFRRMQEEDGDPQRRDLIHRWYGDPRGPLEFVAARLVVSGLVRLADWHKSRFITSARRRFDLGPALSLSDIDADRILRQRIRENVDLIRTIPQRFHDQLARDIARIQAQTPFDEQVLRQTLQQSYDSSVYNLRRLTRDQTQKAASDLNQVRQQQVGITHYQWLDSQDERVRPTHALNGGRIFAWTSPPPLTGHPGNDIQCRCTALGIVPGTQPEFVAEGPASFI